MRKQSFDLVVIGAGPAGEKGAVAAAARGKRVAIVDSGKDVGGASANTGTLPSKTLRETALALSGLKSRALYGVDLSLRHEASVADLMYHETHVTANERARIHASLDGLGIQRIRGVARFEDPHSISVRVLRGDDEPEEATEEIRLLTADTILIATGSAPNRPTLFPFEHPLVYDSDEILALECVPSSLAVIGAGVIGSEYACTFAALGTKVHIIDGRTELLPFLDDEISRALEGAMRDLGIVFHWKEQATGCAAPAEGAVALTLSSGEALDVDAVLVAAGRTGNTAQLNLSAAGIAPAEHGLLKVDARYRTSVPHIYAAGDVIGFPALSSTSAEQARIAMCHACGSPFEDELPTLLPIGVYTIPEVSCVGATEEDLKKQGVAYYVGKALYKDNPRGEIIGDETGFVKLLFRKDDKRLVGVHVIGEHAAELTHVGLIAMMANCDYQIFNRACFSYPTLGDLYKYATFDAMSKWTVPDGIA